MESLIVLLIIAIDTIESDVVLSKKMIDEPVCTSRYDFESSLLKDMVKLDFDMTVLKQSYRDDITNLKTETKLATEKLETVTKQLEETQAQSVQAITDLADNKIKELETVNTLLKEEINTRLSSLELHMKKTLDELRAAEIKGPVTFLVKTLSDTTVQNNMVLKFTERVWNTNNYYDSSSGYFTAPRNGTYLFNLQLCIKTDKYVHIQIVADDDVIANAILHGSGSTYWSCSTLSAISILVRGGRVCARFGSNGETGDILFQYKGNRWAAFMGALVN